MWPDDPDRGDPIVISRQLHLETPVLLEREPLPVGPVPSMATGLPRELGAVGARIDGHRLPGGRASHNPRVEGHGGGHLVCRQRHRVVLHTTLVAKNHLPILRACSVTGLYFDVIEPTRGPFGVGKEHAARVHFAEKQASGRAGAGSLWTSGGVYMRRSRRVRCQAAQSDRLTSGAAWPRMGLMFRASAAASGWAWAAPRLGGVGPAAHGNAWRRR